MLAKRFKCLTFKFSFDIMGEGENGGGGGPSPKLSYIENVKKILPGLERRTVIGIATETEQYPGSSPHQYSYRAFARTEILLLGKRLYSKRTV